MISLRSALWLLAVSALAQPNLSPIPRDPLEIVTGPARQASTQATREAALQLLDRARDSFSLPQSTVGYDLKVSFTVNSGGRTDYDGSWQMEQIFDPQHGTRWSATASSGFTTTVISANGMYYTQASAAGFPLRLQEARAALLDPMPAPGDVSGDMVRTATADYNGTQLTCILMTARRNAAPAEGRRWEETQECIDPQTGLLRLHSQVPGRYYAYDFTNGVHLGSLVFPRTVTVSEGGSVVSTISVDSLTQLPSADPSLFVPTDQMLATDPPVSMGPAQKMSGFVNKRAASSKSAHAVYIFGLVTPSGKLVEAHSLQPSDPRSAEALKAAQRIPFAPRKSPNERPQQHFVFILEKFAD